MKFLAILHKDEDSNYGVIVPELPGCFSAGKTIEEAIENTKESNKLHMSYSNPFLLELFQERNIFYLGYNYVILWRLSL